MTKLFEQAIAEVLELPEETQNMAADALYMVIEHVNENGHYRLTDEQIVNVDWQRHGAKSVAPRARHVAVAMREAGVFINSFTALPVLLDVIDCGVVDFAAAELRDASLRRRLARRAPAESTRRKAR